MKSFILSMLLIASVSVHAKLSDFNSLIEENTKAQKELHSNLKEALSETQVAVQEDRREEQVIVDNSAVINVPTSKGFLIYKKEKSFHSPSESQAQKRLAQEFNSAE